MRNLKISKKLIISYALILFLLVIGIITSIVNLANLGDQVEDFYSGPYTVSSAANTLDSNFEAMQRSVFRSISNSDLNITSDAISDAKAAAAKIQEQLLVIQNNFQGDRSIVDRLNSALTELAPMREEVLNLASQNKNEEAAAYMESHNIPVIEKAQTELLAIIDFADNRGETLITELRSAQTRSVITLSILGIISVLVSLVFGTYISRSITSQGN